ARARRAARGPACGQRQDSATIRPNEPETGDRPAGCLGGTSMLRLRHVSLAAMAVALVLGGAGAASAQAAAQTGARVFVPNEKPAKEGDRVAAGFVAPRLSFGQPDLQGVWSNASNTRMSRPANLKSLVMTDEEEAKARAANPSNIRQAT